jgi:hypothetical protein
MKKLFVLLLLFPVLVFADVDTKDGVSITENTDLDGFTSTIDTCDGQTVAVGCTETYAPAVTQDQGDYVGYQEGSDFVGFVYVPASDECICDIDVQIRQEYGDPTGLNYHISIYTVDGNNDLASLVGTSDAVAGSVIQGAANGSWMSANGDTFSFSPCVNLTGSTEYALVAFVDDDANLTDNPEHDGINYWRWAYDNELGSDGITIERGIWTWDASIPYAELGALDADDRGSFKVSTQ